jgi:hypothetical protein
VRTLGLVTAILGMLAGVGAVSVEEGFVDGVVAQVDGVIVTASDVALGRALGLFGLTAAAGPLSQAEIQRYLDGQLLAREGARIGVEPTAADAAEAWAVVIRRAGGEEALTRWLRLADVDLEWARRLAHDDLRMRQFVDLRFRALAFVSEADLTAALGPGPHDEQTREEMRARLEREAADQRLTEWLAEARTRASVSPRVAWLGQVPNPLPALPGSARARLPR